MGKARDLTRTRSRRYLPPDTGRQHHLGGPPPVVPVHTGDGVDWDEATPARLRELLDAQLAALGEDLERRRDAAAADLAFEEAGRLQERLSRVQEEQRRRAG